MRNMASMNCPACRSPFTKLFFHSVELDWCQTCGGTWLDYGEIDQLFQEEKLPESLMAAETLSKPAMRVPEGHRTCPRCTDFLKLVTVDGISLDVCSNCKGFFTDLGELKSLAEAAEIRFAKERGAVDS